METRAASVETLYTIDPKTGMTPLQVAVKKRQWDEVTKIITTPQLDHKKARSGFALLIAAKENLTTIALTLLETVTDFSYSTGKNGYLAMHWAVANNNLELLTAMIAKGADANSTTKYQQTPLMLAVTLDDINMELLAILCEQTKSFGETVKQAAKDGHWQTVTRLLTVDKLNEQTLCAELLFTAIDQRQLDAINMLLNKGVAYNFFQNGVSAIVHAAKAEYWECVTILMQHPRSGCSISELGLALTIVVAKQNWELATNILKLRPKLDKSFENFTLAQWVIKHNHVEFFNELHQAGTDILTNENNLTTAVQMAVQLRSTDILKRLSVLGVKLDNAITTAVSTKEKGDLQFLIENGGNPAAAFAKAVQDKKWDDVKLLVEASGKQFTKSLTSLFKAVIDDNKPEMVTFLLTHGADPHQTFEGQDNTDTPARYAAQAKKWDCVRAIINSATKICPNKAKLGSALIIAAEQDQWELFSEILKRKPQLT